MKNKMKDASVFFFAIPNDLLWNFTFDKNNNKGKEKNIPRNDCFFFEIEISRENQMSGKKGRERDYSLTE